MREGARFTPRGAAHRGARASGALACPARRLREAAARERGRGEAARMGSRRRCPATVAGLVPLPPSRPWSTRPTRRRRRRLPPPGRSHPAQQVQPDASSPSNRGRARARRARAEAEEASPAGGGVYLVSRAAPAARHGASASASADEGDAPRDPFAPASPPAAPPPCALCWPRPRRPTVSARRPPRCGRTARARPFVERSRSSVGKKHRHRRSPVRQNGPHLAPPT